MIVAHLSDTHITEEGRRYQTVRDTSVHLQRAVERVNGLQPKPDAVVITGDLTQSGYPAQYERLRGVLEQLTVPFFAVPGNHDRRNALRTAFAGLPWVPAGDGPLNYIIDDFPLRLIALDSVHRGSSGGVLTDDSLNWLDERLSEASGRKSLILLHQPPLRTGIIYMDAFGFIGMERFGEIVARHADVVAVLCGHIHRTVTWPWSGSTVIAARSTAPQLVPHVFEWPFGLWAERSRPGFLLHSWDGSALTTRTVLTGGMK